MSPEIRKKLFAPKIHTIDFNGFSLYIAREITNQFGGDIKVESEPNVGSTFSFEFCPNRSSSYSVSNPSSKHTFFNQNLSSPHGMDDRVVKRMAIKCIADKVGDDDSVQLNSDITKSKGIQPLPVNSPGMSLKSVHLSLRKTPPIINKTLGNGNIIILLIDDDIMSVELLKKSIEQLPNRAQLLQANSEEELLNVIQTCDRFNVIMINGASDSIDALKCLHVIRNYLAEFVDVIVFGVT